MLRVAKHVTQVSHRAEVLVKSTTFSSTICLLLPNLQLLRDIVHSICILPGNREQHRVLPATQVFHRYT